MTFLTAEQIQTHRTRTVTNARKAVQEVFGEKFGAALFSTSLRNWGLGPVSTQAFLVGAVDLIQDAWKHHQDIAGVLLCKNPQGGFIPHLNAAQDCKIKNLSSVFTGLSCALS